MGNRPRPCPTCFAPLPTCDRCDRVAKHGRFCWWHAPKKRRTFLTEEQVRRFRVLLAGPKAYTYREAAALAGIHESYGDGNLSKIANGLMHKEGEAANG